MAACKIQPVLCCRYLLAHMQLSKTTVLTHLLSNVKCFSWSHFITTISTLVVYIALLFFITALCNLLNFFPCVTLI